MQRLRSRVIRKKPLKKVHESPATCGTRPSNPRPDTNVRRRLLVRSAIRIIGRDLSQSPTLSMVAVELGVSLWHLSRVFHQCCSITYSDFVDRLRLREVKRLFKNPALTLKEIAGRCGITRSDYFSSWFRNREGCSPTQFRAKYLKIKQ